MRKNNTSFAWKSFLALFGLGLLGILSLVPYARRQVEKAIGKAPETQKLPAPLLVVLALVQSAVLLALAVFGGLKLAPRLGLRSHVASWAGGGGTERATGGLGEESRLALVGALLTPTLIFLGEALFRPWTGEALARLEEELPRTRSLTLMGVLYGGITEELLMRWGLVSLFARLLQRVRGDGDRETSPAAPVMWGAIGIAAVLFGVGHLPAVAALVTLTPALITRTILLNTAGGAIFGFLYWKESLEAAMLAHGGSHVIMSLVQWVRER